MLTPYYSDDAVTLHHGDALAVLRQMPDGCVNCCVTSPPYFGLRDYGVPGQLGAEESPPAYVEALTNVLAEVHRVLADDGTLWLNLGDSYAGGGGGAGGKAGAYMPGGTPRRNGRDHYDRMGRAPKNLLGIPWRVAFALQDDGWTLRNHIVWNKTNAMPESVTDRLSNRHEALFLLTKGPRYWFDLNPIRVPYDDVSVARAGRARLTGYEAPGQTATKRSETDPNPAGKNPGDVWSIPTQPFPGAHFATMPVALAERCIQAGSRPGGMVLDPFSGSGTTGLAAARHGRHYVGIDLNADYLDLSLRTRLQQPGLDLGGIA